MCSSSKNVSISWTKSHPWQWPPAPCGDAIGFGMSVCVTASCTWDSSGGACLGTVSRGRTETQPGPGASSPVVLICGPFLPENVPLSSLEKEMLP